jgi:hypothetical protein
MTAMQLGRSPRAPSSLGGRSAWTENSLQAAVTLLGSRRVSYFGRVSRLASSGVAFGPGCEPLAVDRSRHDALAVLL